MPTRAERETVIVANLADLDEGFFTIHTTEAGVLARLQRAAGSRLVTETHCDSKGKPRSWTLRVPSDLWRGSQLRVAKRRRPPLHLVKDTPNTPLGSPVSDP